MKKNEKYRGIIYKAENKITGEKYIGATTYSLHQRKLDHVERAVRGDDGNFQEAIAKYGTDAFVWEAIDTAENLDELAQKEKQYIMTYNSQEDGYNADNGGGFQKTVYQYDRETGKLIEKFNSLTRAANAVNASKGAIGSACTGVNRTCKGYYWSYILREPFSLPNDKRKKKVIQLSLSGLALAVFDSVSEASKKAGLSKTCIARCCRGEREHSGGYKWQYLRFQN